MAVTSNRCKDRQWLPTVLILLLPRFLNYRIVKLGIFLYIASNKQGKLDKQKLIVLNVKRKLKLYVCASSYIAPASPHKINFF